MRENRQALLSYLRSSPGSPWVWAEEGAVISWHDGATIAFREELIALLSTLEPVGLPPFSSVVLVLAACRGRIWSPKTFEETEIRHRSSPSDTSPTLPSIQTQDPLIRALAEFRRLAELPAELRTSMAAKSSLLRAIFEPDLPQKRHYPFAIRDLQRYFFTEAELNSEPLHHSSESIRRCLLSTAPWIAPHTVESLRLRLSTSLDALPQAAPIQSLPSQQARDLIDHLMAAPEHQIMAKAARELLAAIRLPKKLSEVESLAMGGLSGLTNRGPVDRLLLSELAHDELTLTSRIALNEALYLRHEPPAHAPPTTLALLLDSGLRQWGLPRVLATAGAIAFAGSDSKAKEVRVWRAQGQSVREVDLLHAQGLTEHLATLELETHAGDALAAFESQSTRLVRAQTILITSPEALLDNEFRAALQDHPDSLEYVATIDGQGHFAVYPKPFLSKHPICESQLDIEALLTPTTGGSPSRLPAALRSDLPAFLQQFPTPLRLPFSGKAEYWTATSNGQALAVLSDRRLIEYEGQNHGGQLLVPKLPSGKTLLLREHNGVIQLVKAGGIQRPCRLVTLTPGAPASVIDLCQGEPATAAFVMGGALLVLREHDMYAYSLTDGRILDRLVTPARWHRGRFYTTPQAFQFVHWDGQSIHLLPLPLPPQLGVSKIVTVWDREGHEGPWVLDQSCQAFSLATNERYQIPLPIGQSSHTRNVHISRDGHRIFMSILAQRWHCLFDLQKGRTEMRKSAMEDSSELDPAPPLPSGRTPHRNFDAITADLRLRNRKGQWRRIHWEGDKLEFLESEAPSSKSLQLFRHLQSIGYQKFGCLLDVAEWENGNKAFLDSRGLLHLKSKNSSVPEITLVLDDEEMAAWTTDQKVCGPDFYLQLAATQDFESIRNVLRTFSQQT